MYQCGVLIIRSTPGIISILLELSRCEYRYKIYVEWSIVNINDIPSKQCWKLEHLILLSLVLLFCTIDYPYHIILVNCDIISVMYNDNVLKVKKCGISVQDGHFDYTNLSDQSSFEVMFSQQIWFQTCSKDLR